MKHINNITISAGVEEEQTKNQSVVTTIVVVPIA